MIVDLCTLRLSGPEIARREFCYRLEQGHIPVFPTPSGTRILAVHAQAVAAIVAEINGDALLATVRHGGENDGPLQVSLRPRRGLLPGTERPRPPAPASPGAQVHG